MKRGLDDSGALTTDNPRNASNALSWRSAELLKETDKWKAVLLRFVKCLLPV